MLRLWRWTRNGLALILVLVTVFVLFQVVIWSDLSLEDYESRYYADAAPQGVSLDGVDLRYQVQGQGPPVLLLHSHFFSMSMWDPWVERLADDFTLVRFDMTSHGLTGADPAGRYDMDRSLELVEGLLDHLGLDRVSLVGSSLGGNMAFHFAARHPHRVDRLVLVNSGGLKRENSRAGGEIPAWADTAFKLVPRMAYRAFLEWMIYDDTLVTDALVAEFHDGFRREGNRPAEMDRLRDFSVDDPDPVLSAITAPTLVMWGRENPQLPYELAGQFAAKLTAAEAVRVDIVPGAGHVLPLERPDYSADRVREFLRGEPTALDDLHGYRRGPWNMVRGGDVRLVHDDGREIRARAFHPDGGEDWPVVVFSHGFASDLDQYDALIGHWVSHGYAVLAADHADSGGTVSAIVASIRLGEVELVSSRAADMHLLMESVDSFPGLTGKVHPELRVAAGHSFGAFTAQMMVGAAAIDEQGQRHGYDGPPVKAAIAISPPGEMFDIIVEDSWKGQKGPVLMTTGTADVDGRFVTDWRQHLLSFENAVPGEQLALVVEGADHYLGRLICRLDQDVPAQHEAMAMVNTATTAFLDAHVRDHPQAWAVLEEGYLDRWSALTVEIRRR